MSETVTKEGIAQIIDQGINAIRAIDSDAQALSAMLIVLKLWELTLPPNQAYRNSLLLEKVAEICEHMSKYFASQSAKWREVHGQQVQQEIRELITVLKANKQPSRAVELLR